VVPAGSSGYGFQWQYAVGSASPPRPAGRSPVMEASATTRMASTSRTRAWNMLWVGKVNVCYWKAVIDRTETIVRWIE